MPRLRTGYSFRAAAGSIEECVSRVQEIGWPVAPITDRASTFGWTRWGKAAKDAGLRPVFGVELAVAESVHEKKPSVDFWTFIAKDSLAPINRLIGLATEQFRYQPMLSYEQASAAAADVFVVAGRRAKVPLIGEGVLYGLAPGSIKGHVQQARERGLAFVATSDNVCPRRADLGFYEVVVGRNSSTQTYDQHVQSDEEWLASIPLSGATVEEARAALAMRNSVWESSTAMLQRTSLVSPPRPASLRDMCIAGAARIGCDLSRKEYADRLDRELLLIAEKNFEDYFYLVADICSWARERMAVGPARGSSCGSLVCYLLEITTVDPIPYGLIFERFIDVNRTDLPDIDIDFSDQKRSMVFDRMKEVYGEDRVARLGTVAVLKMKSALQGAGAALKVPHWRCDAILRGTTARSSGDSRANDALGDALNKSAAGQEALAVHPELIVAARTEGHPSHYSQHAAALVVSAEPLEGFVAIDRRTGATMCDKKDAEPAFGLLKIDILGLTQLSVIEDTLDSVGMSMRELQSVPTDDPEAFAVLNRGEFAGIFQWNGNALQSLTKQLNVDRFDDIAAISALARPGPLATGGATEWVHRRMGGVVPPGIHPLLDELTKETYGVVIYQEQVMRIVRELGGFSWALTTEIRKLMSSRQGNERFELLRGTFIEGAGKNGIPEDKAQEIWDQVNTFGSWAFNKSHAVAYAFMSYWCCWLKAHHRLEFAAATLSHEDDPVRQILLLRELSREGVSYVPVDAELSTNKWTAAEGNLIGPLSNVKGFGPKLVQQVMGARARGEAVPERAAKLLANPITPVDSLFPVRDAIARIMPDPRERSLFTPPTAIADLRDGENELVFCTPIKINPRDENERANLDRRDGVMIEDGMTDFLQLRLMDDTGTVMGKVNRFNFGRIGRQIIETGRIGKSLWAFKGKVFNISGDFRVLSIKQARYIGDMDQK